MQCMYIMVAAISQLLVITNAVRYSLYFQWIGKSPIKKHHIHFSLMEGKKQERNTQHMSSEKAHNMMECNIV